MKFTANTYLGGMNRDLGTDKVNNKMYYEAWNGHIITDDGLTSGDYVTSKGNAISFRLPDNIYQSFSIRFSGQGYLNGWVYILSTDGNLDFSVYVESALGLSSFSVYEQLLAHVTVQSAITQGYLTIHHDDYSVYFIARDYQILITSPGFPVSYHTQPVSSPKIVGYGTVRDNLIIFSSADETASPGDTSYDQIWKVTFNTSDNVVDIGSNNTLRASKHLIYNGTLHLSTYYRISESESFVDSNKVQKIYWVDGYNTLRHANITDPDLIIRDARKFDIVPKCDMSQPRLVNLLSGGQFLTGMVQYVYRLVNNFGATTIFSPASGWIHITPLSEGLTSTAIYRGASEGTEANKAVQIQIDNIDTHFDTVEIAALFVSSFHGVPISVRIFYRSAIPPSGSVTVIDDGLTAYETMTLAEYNMIGYDIVPKTMTKDSQRLILANLAYEEVFNVDFDARTYRFPRNGESTYIDGKQIGFLPNGLSYDNGNFCSPVETISETADCALRHSSISDDHWSYIAKYRFLDDVMGGTGPNVSYHFVIREFILDDHAESEDSDDNLCSANLAPFDYPVNTVNHHSNYTNYASAQFNAIFKSNMRDEVYRYAFVFVSKKGLRSYAKWVGDIKFPHISEKDSVNDYYTARYDDTEKRIYGRILGIHFDINLSDLQANYPDVYSEIDYIEIVRAERSNIDRTIVAQGVYETVNWLDYNPNPVVMSNTYGTEQLQGPVAFRPYNNWFLPAPLHNSVTPDDYGEIPWSDLLSNNERHMRMTRLWDLYSIYVHRLYVSALNAAPVNANLTNTISQEYWKYGNFYSPEFSYADNPYVDRTGLFQTEDYMEIAGLSGSFGHTLCPGSGLETGYGNSYVPLDSLAFIKIRNVLPAIPHPYVYTEYAPIGFYSLGEYFGASNYNYNHYTNSFRKSLTQATLVGPAEKISFTGKHYINQYAFPNRIEGYDYAGTNLFIQLDSHFSHYDDVFNYSTSVTEASNHTGKSMIVNYKRALTNQYGGKSYTARRNTEYISTGYIQNVTGVSHHIDVNGGDTYICMYEYLKSMVNDARIEEDLGAQHFTVVAAPIETSVNINVNHGKLYSWYKYNEDIYGPTSRKKLREMNNVSVMGTETEDLYNYNWVFSRPNSLKKFFDNIGGIIDYIPNNDCRIALSNKKNRGELIDNWLKFLPDNGGYVETSYGPINKLYKWKDKVFFFQDRGFGIQAIEERITALDEFGATLVLGEGDIFGESGYVSTIKGTKHQESVIGTDTGLFFFDIINQKIFRYTGTSPEPLSDIKGLKSFLKGFDESIKTTDRTMISNGIGIAMSYDQKTGRIYFTILDTTNRYTVSYNEYLDAFEMFHSFLPGLHVTHNGRIMTVNPSARNEIWLHGNGNKGSYYGTVYDSSVTFIVNAEPAYTKIFNFSEFSSQILDSYGYDVYNETIDYIQVWNAYQDTGVITLSPDNVRRRGRKWRAFIRRAKYDLAHSLATDADSTKEEFEDKLARIRGEYIFIKLTKDNTDNRTLILNDILTDYTIANF